MVSKYIWESRIFSPVSICDSFFLYKHYVKFIRLHFSLKFVFIYFIYKASDSFSYKIDLIGTGTLSSVSFEETFHEENQTNFGELLDLDKGKNLPNLVMQSVYHQYEDIPVLRLKEKDISPGNIFPSLDVFLCNNILYSLFSSFFFQNSYTVYTRDVFKSTLN